MPSKWFFIPFSIITTESKFGVVSHRIHRHIECKQISVDQILSHHRIEKWCQSILSHCRVCKPDNSVEATTEDILFGDEAELVVRHLDLGVIAECADILHEVAIK